MWTGFRAGQEGQNAIFGKVLGVWEDIIGMHDVDEVVEWWVRRGRCRRGGLYNPSELSYIVWSG